MQTLAHDFYLLSLDDSTGSSLLEDDIMLKAAISAAWLGEMMFADRLIPTSANVFALAPGALSPGILGRVEKGLVEAEPAPLQTHITTLWGWWTQNDLLGWIQDDLVARGVLRVEADKFWFITYNTRHPALDMTKELSTRQRLRQHLSTVRAEDPPCRDDALISLLRASKILDTVWTEAEQVVLQAQIEERTKRAPLGLEAKNSAEGTRAALLAVTVIAGT